MKEFKKELKELLEKYDARIFVEQDNNSFLYLKLVKGKEESVIDSGYIDLEISSYRLK